MHVFCMIKFATAMKNDRPTILFGLATPAFYFSKKGHKTDIFPVLQNLTHMMIKCFGWRIFFGILN